MFNVQTRVVDLEDKATGAAKQAGSKLQEQVSSTASSVVGGVKAKVSSSGSDTTPAHSTATATAPTTETLGDQHHTRMPTD